MQNRPAIKHPQIPADIIRKKLNFIFNEHLTARGFINSREHNVWLRKKSDVIFGRLAISSVERLLPTYFIVDPNVGICTPDPLNRLSSFTEQNIDNSKPVFTIKLSDIFPREEYQLERTFDLESFDSEKNLENALKDIAALIANRAECVFAEFQTYEDLLNIHITKQYPWGKKISPYLPFKQEMIGLLHFVLNEKNKCEDYFKALAVESENFLKDTSLVDHKRDHYMKLALLSQNVLAELSS